jgi:hypothetical protein
MEQKISDYSTEDLYNEIDRRNKEELQNDHFICLGIMDNDGVESIVKINDKEHFARTYNSLSLRARFNGHRSTILYTVKITQPLLDLIQEKLKDGEYIKVSETLQELSTFKNIGY